MSSPIWTDVLSELNHDCAREAPRDVVQWGADWFQARLKRDVRALASIPSYAELTIHLQRLSSNGTPMNGAQYPPTSLSALPPAMQQHLYPHAHPSPFSEHPPHDSPFAPRRATEPTPNTRNGAPTFASPFGGGAAIPPTALPHEANLGPRSSIAVHDDPVIPSYALGRRTSVSAESLVPTAQRAFSTSGGLDTLAENDSSTGSSMPRYPKTDDQLARIKTAIKPNFLFRNLDEEQEADVLGAMKEVKVPAGELVIEQGAAGDFFYVVESGELDVYIKKEGQVLDGNKGDHQKLGKKVLEYKEGSSFGELALMHK